MRRIICAAAAVLVAGSAAQAVAGQLALANVTGKAGQSVTVPLTFRQGSGPVAVALGADIRFNASVLSNPRCAAGSAVSASGPTAKLVTCAQPQPGMLRIAILGLNSAPLPDGEVATVVFDIAPSARRRLLALRQKSGGADASGTDFRLKRRNGSIRVTPAH